MWHSNRRRGAGAPHRPRRQGRRDGGVGASRSTNKNGERQDGATWRAVEVWSSATVDWLASRGLPKGAKVSVEGEIRNDRSTDGQGIERYVSKVVVATAGPELKSLGPGLRQP